MTFDLWRYFKGWFVNMFFQREFMQGSVKGSGKLPTWNHLNKFSVWTFENLQVARIWPSTHLWNSLWLKSHSSKNPCQDSEVSTGPPHLRKYFSGQLSHRQCSSSRLLALCSLFLTTYLVRTPSFVSFSSPECKNKSPESLMIGGARVLGTDPLPTYVGLSCISLLISKNILYFSKIKSPLFWKDRCFYYLFVWFF